MSRLKYNNRISSEDLITRYQYDNTYQVPKLERLVVSLSLKSSGFNRKNLPRLLMASTIITGQKTKPVITKQGDAAFGIRKNDPVATKVTLRGNEAFYFMDFVNTIVLPKVKNFEGLSRKNINQNKAFNFQINNPLSFPQLEMAYEMFNNVGPVNISLISSSSDKINDGETFWRNLGLPFN
jgi:large subunit ribosomal protein L5|tara:strand:- start:32 stop:574 length:543 start_codon:yes stop_codon:yes gene_type:complete